MDIKFLLLDTAAKTAEKSSSTSDTSTAGSGGGLGGMALMVLYIAVFILIMYFVMIRPQNKKRKEEQKLRESLRVGDEIVTIGGIYGRIISLKEDTMVIESKSDHSKLTFARWALQQNLTVHDDEVAKKK